MSRDASRLDQFTSVVMILASVAVVWHTRQREGAPPPAGVSIEARRLEYSVGDSFPDLPGVKRSHVSAVLFLHSSCPFCTASMPFYRSLSAYEELQFVAVGTEPPDSISAYLDSHGVTGMLVASIAPGQLRFTATPTLVLLNNDASVAGVWRGRLDSHREAEVKNAIHSLFESDDTPSGPENRRSR